MEDTLLLLFVLVDDFCKDFVPEWNKYLIENRLKKRCKPCRLSMSEIITLVLHFHQMRFRDFKTYYQVYVSGEKSGIYFLDSLIIKACHIKREK